MQRGWLENKNNNDTKTKTKKKHREFKTQQTIFTLLNFKKYFFFFFKHFLCVTHYNKNTKNL